MGGARGCGRRRETPAHPHPRLRGFHFCALFVVAPCTAPPSNARRRGAMWPRGARFWDRATPWLGLQGGNPFPLNSRSSLRLSTFVCFSSSPFFFSLRLFIFPVVVCVGGARRRVRGSSAPSYCFFSPSLASTRLLPPAGGDGALCTATRRLLPPPPAVLPTRVLQRNLLRIPPPSCCHPDAGGGDRWRGAC